MTKKREDFFEHMCYNSSIQNNKGGKHMKKKPGVMVYFDMRRMVKLLTDEEKGKLFEAMYEELPEPKKKK